MDLELENNNMICAVKEIYSRFVSDTYIAQRIKLCKATLLGDLVVEVANIVEKQIDQARKAKRDMIGEIQAKFLEVSNKVDNQVKKLFKDAEPKHNNFVENRLKNYVFEYNRLAEEDRLGKCDIRKKKMFHKVYLDLQKNSASQDGREAAKEGSSVSGRTSSSGDAVEVRFKSNNSLANPSTAPVKKTDETNPTGDNITNQSTVKVEPEAPELTDDQFKKICDSTKLSEPEVVEIEGLSGSNHLYHLSPLVPSRQAILLPGDIHRSGDQRGRETED